MKSCRLMLVFVFAVIMMIPVAANSAAYMGNFMNGDSYMKLDETNRGMVVLGMYDMLSYLWGEPIFRDAADAGTRNNMQRVRNCLAQKKPNEIRAMLDKYLTDNPDKRVYNIASNFSAALNRMCP